MQAVSVLSSYSVGKAITEPRFKEENADSTFGWEECKRILGICYKTAIYLRLNFDVISVMLYHCVQFTHLKYKIG